MKVLKFCTLYISSLVLPAIGSDSLSEDTYANDMEDLQRKMQALTISSGEKKARKSCALSLNKNAFQARNNLPPIPPKDRLGFVVHKSASSSNLLALSRVKQEVQQPKTARDSYGDNEFEEDYMSPEKEEASSSCCSEISISTDSEATEANIKKDKQLGKRKRQAYGDSDYEGTTSKKVKKSHKKKKNRGYEVSDRECDNGNVLVPARPRTKAPGQRRQRGSVRMSKSSDLPMLNFDRPGQMSLEERFQNERNQGPRLDLDRVGQMSQERFFQKRRKNSKLFRFSGCPRAMRFNADPDEDSEENRNKNFVHILQILIAKHFSNAFPEFVQLIIEGYEHKNCSFAELVEFVLHEPNEYEYVKRDRRQPRKLVAMHCYVEDAISGEDGIVNRVKRNIIDEIIMWLSLSYPELPDEFIDQLDHVVTNAMAPIVDALRKAVILELQHSDFDADYVMCCGCKCKKLSPEAKQQIKEQILSGVGGILHGVTKKFLGEEVADGVSNLFSGITSIFTGGENDSGESYVARPSGRFGDLMLSSRAPSDSGV